MADLTLSILQTLIDWDTSIFLAVNSVHNEYWDNFMEMFSGRFIWVPFYVSFAWVMFRNFHWRVNVICLAAAILLLIIDDQVCSTVIRSALARMRPSNPDNPISPMVHVVNDYRGGSYGFPSAHAANCWGTTFFIIYVFRRHLLSVTMVLWAIAMCYSRMYLGVHYFGDVLAGMLLGLINASIIYYIFHRTMRSTTEKFKPNQLYAPQMYVPVIVCWSEVMLMLILAFGVNPG